MTREDIIRMAREAGFVVDEKAQQHQPNCIFHTWHMIDEGLTRFAALVTAAQRDALLAALKNIDKEFSKHGRQHWPEAVKARAAIAKAEEKA